ncbi:MAG TPA: ISL3 family transposase [Ktedonobacteraceae bacterium]
MIMLPPDSHLLVEQMQLGETLTITLRSTQPSVACPSCGSQAEHIHSRYRRTLTDLPSSGQPVRLVVQVRRFFCRTATCPRKTFAEPLATLARPHAQRTLRLQSALQRLGLALGGKAGARLGQHLGMAASPDSLLRLIRQAPLPSRAPATAIGLDDWAYKRRLRYGTLICDLDTGHPIDLLADRSVQTVSTWLQEHPEVKIISRDRWSEYATAAQKGAPQAVQVADRFHLLANLVESLTSLLARCRAEIRQAVASDTRDLTAGFLQPNQAVLSPLQTQRRDQFAQVQVLHQLGLTPVQIAARVGIGERTVYRWLVRQQVPDWHHRSRGTSILDPYRAYIFQRYQEGCRKGVQLLREVKAQGYQGSERAVYRYLTFLRTQEEQAPHRAVQPQEDFSAKRAVWLLIQESDSLDELQQQTLAFIRQASIQVEQAYQLAQSFTHMLRHRQGERLDEWLQEVLTSSLPELRQFAAGIQRDKAAVQASLTLSYSNGLVEGQINRLKLIKRSMYGRAKFDLLRQRVLCAS